MKKHIPIILLLCISVISHASLPQYFEINKGESYKLDKKVSIKLVETKVESFDSVQNRIQASSVIVEINKKQYQIYCGYESLYIEAGDHRVGVDYIRDYDHIWNNRLKLKKDVRMWVSNANENFTAKGTHVYPLLTPWNSGIRNQGWLTVAINNDMFEGLIPYKGQRYHDGFDFGVWEGQLVRSVGRGIVVTPQDYPQLLKEKKLYDSNKGKISGNPLLIKSLDLPLIFYYTHMSGLSKNMQPGDTIQKGEIIGYTSNRGSSGGWYHLHFGILHLGMGLYVNPYPYLKEWYNETMTHYGDFISRFQVFTPKSKDMTEYEFERAVITNQIQPDREFNNTIPGIVHMREAVTDHPFTGLNHWQVGQQAIMQTTIRSDYKQPAEVWFGHTGIARLYLNNELIYSGENGLIYKAKNQPFQWDKEMIPCTLEEGENKITIFIKQTNHFWSYSIRVRDKLGRPLNKKEN